MMLTAKVFQSGRSQAVRVPKCYRFHSAEVNIQKTPDGLLLTEKSPLELFDEGIGELSDDFMAERVQLPSENRDFPL
jgi:antitoxin VapB